MKDRERFLVPLLVATTFVAGGCEDGSGHRGGGGAAGAVTAGGSSGAGGAGVDGGAGTGGTTASAGSSGQSCAPSSVGAHADVTVDATARTERTTEWSLGYWTWAPSYDDPLEGTEDLIAVLAPPILRIGGYNNDASLPDPFDQSEMDDAAAYAAATGSRLILQLPLLAMPGGARPTPDDVAAMLSYANVTQGYAIPFVSIGNEPDLYRDQGGLSEPTAPAIANYTPEQYCAEVAPLAAALRAVDPTVEIVGPDLGYKYQDFDDWLTPILNGCGELFDRIAIHRYAFEASAVTTAAAYQDMGSLRAVISNVRARMDAAGVGDKPLGITEANLAYVASPIPTPAGNVLGTITHALWIADFIATTADLGLWIASIYDIADQDEWKLGVVGVAPERPLRPAYHALLLTATPAGPISVATSTNAAMLRSYATRDANDSRTHLVLVHWGTAPITLSVRVDGLEAPALTHQVTLPALSVNALVLPDGESPTAQTYGEPQFAADMGPAPLAVECATGETRDGP